MDQHKMYKNKKYAKLDEAQAESRQQTANERERVRTGNLTEKYRLLNNLLCRSDNAAKRSQQEILAHAIEHITELRTALQTAQQPHSDTVRELYQYMGVQPSGSDSQHHVACRMPSLDPQPDVRQYGIDQQFSAGLSSCRYQPNVTHNGLLDYNMSAIQQNHLSGNNSADLSSCRYQPNVTHNGLLDYNMSAIQQNHLSGNNSADLSSCRYQPNVTHNGLLDYNMSAIQQNHLSGNNSADLSSCRFQTAGGAPKRRRLSPAQTWSTQAPHLLWPSGGSSITSPPTSPPTASSSPTTSLPTASSSPTTSPTTSPPTASSSPTSSPPTASSSPTSSPTTSPTSLQIPSAAQFNQTPAPYTAMGIAMNNVGYSFII